MKKFVLIFVICLLCGCAKEEKNITINIYENSDKNDVIEEIKEEDDIVETDVDSKNEIKDTEKIEEKVLESNNNLTEIHDESTLNKVTNKVKESYNNSKEWYDDNKDELKDINSQIIENDKQTINGWIDKTTTWYQENKDYLKQETQKIYENDKQTIQDLYNKIKN